MKREKQECHCSNVDAQGKTEHIMTGFLPAPMFSDNTTNNWINSSVCTECGDLHTQEITDQEYDWAERRFLRALVDTGNMSRQEAKEILGLD